MVGAKRRNPHRPRLAGRDYRKFLDTKALIVSRSNGSPSVREKRTWWFLIQNRAFVLVTVYSDADRTGLFEIRGLPSVKQVDMVLGAFDAVVTLEAQDEKAIAKAVASISRTRGVKEAKPLIEVYDDSHESLKPVIGSRP